MKYINVKGNYGIETIDEFETYKEAKEMLKHYRLIGDYNFYYISQKSTKLWKERD